MCVNASLGAEEGRCSLSPTHHCQLIKTSSPPTSRPHLTVQAAIGSTANIRHLLQDGEEEQPPATFAPEPEEARVSPGTATPEELAAALGERAQLFPGLDQQEGGQRRLQQQGENDDDEEGFLIIQPIGIIGLPPIIVVPLEALAPAPETEILAGGGRRLSQLAGGDEDGVTLEERMETLQEVLGEILVAPEAEEILQVVVAPETE